MSAEKRGTEEQVSTSARAKWEKQGAIPRCEEHDERQRGGLHVLFKICTIEHRHFSGGCCDGQHGSQYQAREEEGE